MKRLILEISSDGQYFKPAKYVVLDLDAEKIEAIKELAARVKRGDRVEASISLSCRAANLDFFAPLDNGKIALKEIAGWMDSVHLNIAQDDFFLTGFYGYSDVSWKTGPVPMAVLDEEGAYDMR